MKKIISIKYLFIISLFTFVFTSCDDEDYVLEEVDDTVALTNGTADFSKFVAIGNSLTAGFTDGALFIAAQNNSMPNLLANKFAMTGGGVFTQPLMSDNIGGLLLGGNVVQPPRLFFNGAGPARLDATPTTEISNIISGPFNNVGVPGAKSFHLLANGYGNVAGVALGLANPYYARMASSPNASIIEDVVAQNPTFFTLWIGSNDVLSYAVGGGTGTNQLGNFDPSTYGSQDITDPNVFAGVYTQILSAVTANGSKGVVLNLPYVTSIPYFTTIPHAPLDPTSEAFGPQIPTLNATFAPLNQAYTFLGVPERSIVFSQTAASPVVIHDETIPNIAVQLAAVLQGGGLDPVTAGLLANQYGQSRQATEAELLVLPSSSIIGQLNQTYFDNLVLAGVPPATAGQLSINGITYPLQDKWVLLPSEQLEANNATDAFNAVIGNLLTNQFSDLAFIDANQLMNNLANGGLPFDEFVMNNSLVFGNTFSLDGVHITARGNAFIANEILMAIDAKYESNFMGSNNLNKAIDYDTQYPATLQ